MNKQVYAIASCRVSSHDQLLNNSLKRQRNAVLQAAEELNAVIPDEYWWSGKMSSKKGTNINRTDLKAMRDACKKDKRIKYLIVDEPDRFMRSVDEAMFFEVRFQMLGVKVWYACNPELNKGDLTAKLLKFTKYLQAEGSNDERIKKSLDGTLESLKEGRYPGPIKLGYKKGYVSGVQEIDEEKGPVLRSILIDIATQRKEPTEALKDFNKSIIRKGKPPLKMDKFRTLITDPFYCRIVEINKQVKFRNENALHEGLISREQHDEILNIMNNKKKNQKGPRKGGNPLFPLNNLVTHDTCLNEKYPRIVGFPHTNGKNNDVIYYRYKCRGCGQTMRRDDIDMQVKDILSSLQLSNEAKNELKLALSDIWKQEEKILKADIIDHSRNIRSLEDVIAKKVDAATDPTNLTIKEDILKSIEHHKAELKQVQESLEAAQNKLNLDKSNFFDFALTFLDEISSKFFEVTPIQRLKCKQLLFPDGFYLNVDKNVYTPTISPLYRLETIKIGTEMPQMSSMVRVRGL